jgi:lipopolysaccharide transport system permease protein
MATTDCASSIQAKQPVTIIQANYQSAVKQYLLELWRFKQLFVLLAWRDLLVRYKQMAIGFAWVILRPLITVIVFSVVFGQIANLPSGHVPYLLFVFAAMIPWQFFANALSEASNSLVSNVHIISKIYFPRMLVPLASLGVCLFDALIVFVLFIMIMAWYHVWPSWQMVFLPIFILWLCLITFSVSIWAAALNVTYRDFRYLIPFVIQLGVYLCPVGFSSELISGKWLWLYYLNPLAGIIDGFRWCFFGSSQVLHIKWMIPSIFITLLFFFLGTRYFCRSEETMVDRI